MKSLKSYGNESGVALVISLMFLSLLALLGSTAVVLTTTDLRIGSNYRQNARTFYEAEAGVQFVIGTIENDLENGTTVANGTANVLPTSVGTGASVPFTASPSGFSISVSNIEMVSQSPDVFSFTSTGIDPNSGAETGLEVQFVRDPYDPAFGVGIVSDSNITIHGSPTINGGMHANGSLNQTGGGGTINGDVSAVGSASAGSCGADCTLSSGVDPITVPQITAADFNAWRTKAMTAPNIYSATDYAYSLTGDQGGKIVFSDGNISIQGSADLENVTLIAQGNVTFLGSSSLNTDGTVGAAIIAGGNIEFNGSNTSYGAFWCNGEFRNNGASTLVGSIVAGGSVTRNGAFNFTYNGDLNNDNLPPGYECQLITWKDLRLAP